MQTHTYFGGTTSRPTGAAVQEIRRPETLQGGCKQDFETMGDLWRSWLVRSKLAASLGAGAVSYGLGRWELPKENISHVKMWAEDLFGPTNMGKRLFFLSFFSGSFRRECLNLQKGKLANCIIVLSFLSHFFVSFLRKCIYKHIYI